MKIAIDLSVTRGLSTGIGYYTLNLLKYLANIDKKNDYLLYTYYLRARGYKIDKSIIPTQRNFTIKSRRIPQKVTRFLWDKMHIPIEFFIGRIDILHSLYGISPPVKYGKLVATIHDIAFLLFPEYCSTNKYLQRYIKPQFLKTVERADKIIVPSNNTKKDIMKILNISEANIKVIYEAAEEIFKPVREEKILKEVRVKYGLNRKFILFVGTLEPRKNISILIKAYFLLKKHKKVEHDLVIVGKKGWLYNDIFYMVNELHLKNEIIFTGYVPREDLPALYSSADLFVYPSLYEGFGLPPLEAMACGVPVITSDTSCFPEIVGEAGILIEPHNEEELSEVIYRVLNDAALRKELVEKGFKRASLFSWQQNARETLKFYEDVYQS